VRAGDTPLLLQRDRDDSQSKDDVLMLNGLRLVLERTLADDRTPAAARTVLEHRIRDLERSVEAGRFERITNMVRRRGAKLRGQLSPETVYAETPPDVAAAFPELAREGRGGGSSQG
jgi:hypothetical protein